MRALGGLALALAQLGAGAAADDLGRTVFTQIAQPSCGVCHTLEDAGASGTIGPSLDELQPDEARVAQAVREGVGIMPGYGEQLTPEQIEAVAAYVASVAGK